MKNPNKLSLPESAEPTPAAETSAAEALSPERLQRLAKVAIEQASETHFPRTPENIRAASAPALQQEYAPEELNAHPELRFNVNPDCFPIFRDQATAVNEGGRIHNVPMNINEVLGKYVTATADLIAVIAGEADGMMSRHEAIGKEQSEAVIYLDKSARPVSWMVDAFWDDFTEREHSHRSHFMVIDRLTWFRAVGLNVDGNGNLAEDYGAKRAGDRADFGDFRQQTEKNPVSRSDIARARLALIPGGTESLRAALTPEELAEFDQLNPLAKTDSGESTELAPALPDWLVNKIFSVPTGLEGKTITVVDEVEHSGATLSIAKYLISAAINDENTKIQTHVFYNDGVAGILSNGGVQKGASPVWYDHDANPELGKGVGDVSYEALRSDFIANPSHENWTRLYACPFTGRRLDLSAPEGESSRELQTEIARMRELYATGHILMPCPDFYNDDRYMEKMESLGIIFTPDTKVKNSLVAIQESFRINRPA